MKRINTLLLLLLVIFTACTGVEDKISYEEYINDDWKLIPSSSLLLSQNDFELHDVASGVYYDVDLPSTVLSGLIQNGEYNDLYFSNNIDTVSTERFQSSWYYIKDFTISNWSDSEHYSLTFEGINYKANIWINGYEIATDANVEGPFRIFNIDITEYAQSENRVVVEVFPPEPTSLTIGFVDWNPEAPDRNMGLWRGVMLKRNLGVSIDNVVISSNINMTDLSSADLTIDAELRNNTSEAISGTFKGEIDGGIKISHPFDLAPNEVKRIVLNHETNQQLRIKNPKLWWPHNMGEPVLYNANFSTNSKGKTLHSKSERFGIRKIEDYTFERNGLTHRGYKINGKKVLLRGGGWVDDLLLADKDEKVRTQVEYVKDMNMNLIRLEGFWANSKELYHACEENGILLMIGLSCQWEWEAYCGRPETDFMSVETDHDIEMITKSFQDQMKWGMNNPAIFLWVYGSDKLPVPKFENSLNSAIREYDKERAILTSCQNVISEVTGPSGSKMFGPYEYVAPIYWYTDKRLGGAYGFNTETGPGAQIPPIESIKRMLKTEDLELINDEGWQFHSGRNEFQSLDRFLENYYARYWKDDKVEDFAFNVQMSNYEAVRAMFEAFIVNRNNEATGVVQWMLNSAWPEMVWQLYDWYLNPNGAYFGTKAANQPINLIYNYGDKGVYVSNMTLEGASATAEVELFDVSSTSLKKTKIDVDIEAEKVEQLLSLQDIDSESNVYFLSLKLFGKDGNELSNNFYWLSQKEDEPEFGKSNWFYTPNKQHASFAQLNDMETAEVDAKWSIKSDGEQSGVVVDLKNNSDKLAFFIEMLIVDDNNQTILPVVWSDNYVSLLPGESRSYSVSFPYNNMSADAQLVVRGVNSGKVNVVKQ